MAKRAALIRYVLLLLLFILFLRLCGITQNTAYQAASVQNAQKTVTLYHTRAPIYDRDLTPLTAGSELHTVTVAGRSTCYAAPSRQNTVAPHILGYLSDGVGVTGIEAAYDAFLTAKSERAYASLPVLGTGQPVPNARLALTLPAQPSNGVVLTLDAELQQMVTACEAMLPKGAIVCLDAETAEILALASFPSYSSPAAALTDPDTPLFNRAFGAYAVGSVMKPVIAAAALDCGISPNTAYDCKGYATVGNIRFGCHHAAGHGVLNLYGALLESCNPYFISLTEDLSAETLLETAQSFGFGESIPLASGMNAAAGSLPDKLPAGEKANFSFGQGKLTATPLQIAAAYAAIANGGSCRAPTLVKGLTKDGKTLQPASSTLAHRVMKEDTAGILQAALYKAVNESEGSKARSEKVRISGKTGTAQTGRYKEGKEELIGWFAGWMEIGDKKIAIAVMAEEAVSGNSNAAPVVKYIAEKVGDG